MGKQLNPEVSPEQAACIIMAIGSEEVVEVVDLVVEEVVVDVEEVVPATATGSKAGIWELSPKGFPCVSWAVKKM